MADRSRMGSMLRSEMVVIGFIAAALAGFVGSFFVAGMGTLNTFTILGVILVVLGFAGLVAVLFPRLHGGDRAARLHDRLLEITRMLKDADAIPHQKQVLWEINRATDALDRGDMDSAAEAVESVRNLLGDD